MRVAGLWRVGSAALGVVVSVIGLAALPALPAQAVGDAGLSKFIIANPVPGWQAESEQSLARVVSYIGGLEVDSIVPKGGNAVTAVQGWQDPADSSHYVVVALVALRFDGASTSSVASQTQRAALGALASLCAGVAPESSVQTETIAAVPASHTLTCTPSTGTLPYAAGWARANTLALVLSVQGAISTDQLTAIATAQYGAMPLHGFAVAPAGGSSGVTTVVELVTGALVLAVVGYVLWRMLQRTAPAAAVEPAGKPEVRRGVVQRPASLAGGVGPSARPPPGPSLGGDPETGAR